MSLTMLSPSVRGKRSSSHIASQLYPTDPPSPAVERHRIPQHLYVLPVLLLEFLALALTRAIIPSLLLQQYGNNVYMVLGAADAVRGILAFGASPLFGRLSDTVGRRPCLFITVIGTCAPVCSLAFFPWTTEVATDNLMTGSVEKSAEGAWSQDHPSSTLHPRAMTIFIVLLMLSGVFTSTFTLVFAYISDSVRHQDERVSAYGLALATFGLSFTIGPLAGGYLAHTLAGRQMVFIGSLVLTILDLLYIYFVLPESNNVPQVHTSLSSTISMISMDHRFSWNPLDTIRLVIASPFLRQVGIVAFFYYTGMWAVLSTLSVYAVKRFHLTPERLGELMAVLGLSTMIAEAVLVRIVVPLLGEKRAMRIGLLSFAIQCVVLGLAFESWHLFVCVAFSLVGNLVYPSLSSLISGSVEPDAVGEALGAINGIKALTEGVGPLIFGSLMTLSEHTWLPGWPYVLASLLIVAAYKAAEDLPDDSDEDYLYELERKHRYREEGVAMQDFAKDDDDEYEGLLSEIEESDSDQPCDREGTSSPLPSNSVEFKTPRKSADV